MKIRYFTCPKCGEEFSITNFWSWVFHAPFHAFCLGWWQDYRYTKCPHCDKRSWLTWHTITRH